MNEARTRGGDIYYMHGTLSSDSASAARKERKPACMKTGDPYHTGAPILYGSREMRVFSMQNAMR
jgi:hypothetical protein